MKRLLIMSQQKKILESAKKHAEKKAILYFHEENWLANYLITV